MILASQFYFKKRRIEPFDCLCYGVSVGNNNMVWPLFALVLSFILFLFFCEVRDATSIIISALEQLLHRLQEHPYPWILCPSSESQCLRRWLMFFLFLNCNVSLPFSHTFFLWIVDTDKRMKLIFRMPVDLKYFSIFCRFSYGSYGCSHSRRHQPGLPITLYSSFLLIWKWKLPFIKHWRQFPSPGYGPRFVFSLKQRNKKIPLYLNTVTFGIIYLR